ncbi:hypothetical protein ZIOFF_051193 [Zingiber officinale]|uniref:Integrase catalytic domain-containing protein n=1 Tax=Zingiber officinale TaxID=94328 RepID=A0A8J5FIA4_ZINOF|nr:hypothetical protein ZIOFF_051193 [Zingiber officinale]
MWVFILTAKNDAFRAFKKFKLLTKTKTEYKIKTLRTDQGCEFLSTEFTQFCENEGIERHLTAPYTPQQNGVVECHNRTVMTMARSLLKGTHMPASANNEERVPEFMVVDAFGTDEVIVAANIEVAAEDVTTPAVVVARASSPSTPSSNTNTTSSPSITNSPESYEGPGRFRSIADIYANIEEAVGVWKSLASKNVLKNMQYIQEVKEKKGYLLEWIEVEQQKSRILLRQSAYAKKILSQFKMTDCNSTKHPMEPKTQLHKDLEGTPVDATEYLRIIGCLRYLLHTRPDLSYSVGMASRYMERPTIMHHKEPQEIGVFGYSDSDLTGDLDGRKSTSGMAFYFNESLVSWNSQKQKTVALSSCEAEFMATTTAACHALWLRSLTSELTGVEPKPITLFVDNKSAIVLIKNLVFHGRSKHIDTRFHFIRECVEKGRIVVEFVNTEEQRANALTKALPGVKLATMRQLLGVRDLEPCQD